MDSRRKRSEEYFERAQNSLGRGREQPFPRRTLAATLFFRMGAEPNYRTSMVTGISIMFWDGAR